MVTRITQYWWGWWRHSKSPSISLPLAVRSVGQARVKPGWKHNTGQIKWVNVYWGTSGQIELIANSSKHEIKEDHILIHRYDTGIRGIPVKSEGSYRWMTLDGLLTMEIIESLGLACDRPVYAGKCPLEIFDSLEKLVQGLTEDDEFCAGDLAYRILTTAARSRDALTPHDKEHAVINDACRIMDNNFSDPYFDIQQLSREMNINRSQLSRMFSLYKNMPPSIYLQRLRTRRALLLLKHSDLPIKQIALNSGFSDPAYFSRCITKQMGLSPRLLRNSL